MLFFWTFYSLKNCEKNDQFPQKYKAAQLLNIYNNMKCYLSSKSAY